MKSHLKSMTLTGFLALMVALLGVPSNAQALIPPEQQYVRFIYDDGSFAYFGPTNEGYIKNTLPNEWVPGWNIKALRAGAVIIRGGAYWRTNRSILQSPQPWNNCHYGGAGGYIWYVKAPTTQGGHEMYIPGSEQQKTTNATNDPVQNHPERVNLRAGAPDKLLSFAYNANIQNRTNSVSGSWTVRIRYAYVGAGHPGAPFNPNTECSQTDSLSDTDPVFPNN